MKAIRKDLLTPVSEEGKLTADCEILIRNQETLLEDGGLIFRKMLDIFFYICLVFIHLKFSFIFSHSLARLPSPTKLLCGVKITFSISHSGLVSAGAPLQTRQAPRGRRFAAMRLNQLH